MLGFTAIKNQSKIKYEAVSVLTYRQCSPKPIALLNVVFMCGYSHRNLYRLYLAGTSLMRKTKRTRYKMNSLVVNTTKIIFTLLIILPFLPDFYNCLLTLVDTLWQQSLYPLFTWRVITSWNSSNSLMVALNVSFCKVKCNKNRVEAIILVRMRWEPLMSA